MELEGGGVGGTCLPPKSNHLSPPPPPGPPAATTPYNPQPVRLVQIRRMAALNVAYWIAFSGAQMTLLPLMLVDDKFGLGPVRRRDTPCLAGFTSL